MSHRKHSQHTSRSNHDLRREATYAPKHTKQLGARERYYSRYTDAEEIQPRRRRWAAGYIDRHSCPSYAYTNTRSRSPDDEYPSDTEYIAGPRYRNDDYIQPREHHGRRVSQSDPRHERDQRIPPTVGVQDGRRSVEQTENRRGSDVEELTGYQDSHARNVRERSCGSHGTGASDVVNAKRRSIGSDVASIPSRRSSNSRSDRRSSRSLGGGSNVQERKRSSSSGSDSEGGYISLDEYIAGRSDCVSDRSFSEDDGEGSDAVGSDIVGGSDVAHGSDVASLSDSGDYGYDEDCIEDEYDGYCDRYRRR